MKKRAKAGELAMSYGVIRSESLSPDLYFLHAAPATKRDSSMLYYYIACERKGFNGETEISFIKQLEERGYDLNTLKFSIQKKESP